MKTSDFAAGMKKAESNRKQALIDRIMRANAFGRTLDIDLTLGDLKAMSTEQLEKLLAIYDTIRNAQFAAWDVLKTVPKE